MNPVNARRRFLALLPLVVAGMACAATPSPHDWLQRLQQSEVVIESGEQRHRFRAWVADTPAVRARGLMFVEELAADQGMLFLFDLPQFASFWMQNTYVPLDLLFVAPDGRIVNIIENATPLSRAPLESIAPVKAVLEVVGGTASRLGIRPGDKINVGPGAAPNR